MSIVIWHLTQGTFEMRCCESSIPELEEELKNLIIKSKNIKQEYLNFLNINLHKDLAIRKINKKLEQNRFASFEKDLPEDCLTKLRSIGNSQSEDSHFVSVIFNELYNNDTQIVKSKCLGNRTKNQVQSAITPEKKAILERIFAERLSVLASSDDRKKSLSKLIRNAIDNAARKKSVLVL